MPRLHDLAASGRLAALVAVFDRLHCRHPFVARGLGSSVHGVAVFVVRLCCFGCVSLAFLFLEVCFFLLLTRSP